jgi:hypothetical protein
LFLLATLALPMAWAQSDKFGQPMDRVAPGKADQAEGARILADFRRAGIAGDYWMSFNLRVMPRRGAERTIAGTLLGMSGASGPRSRLNVGGQNYLIESGPEPEAWAGGASGPVVSAPPGQSVAGTGVTIFDLQMPFLYWTDFTYEGQAKVRGRPTHSFILRPPPGYVPPQPDLTGVRVLIDAEFQAALVQAELLGADGAAEKIIALLDLKKVGDQYLPKTFDVRDLRSRDKTRLTITAAAINLNLPAETFAPGNLLLDPPAVPSKQIVRF